MKISVQKFLLKFKFAVGNWEQKGIWREGEDEGEGDLSAAYCFRFSSRKEVVLACESLRDW